VNTPQPATTYYRYTDQGECVAVVANCGTSGPICQVKITSGGITAFYDVFGTQLSSTLCTDLQRKPF
jgi:hypothetical protein